MKPIQDESQPVKTVLVVFSYHHHNTEKIAHAMAPVLDAQVKRPQEITPGALQDYNLIGFGSGIYDGKNHPSLLDLADNLPLVTNRKVFIFSTCGIPVAVAGRRSVEEYALTCHQPLREKLLSKGYTVIGEFGCAGFNTNSFLHFFGGVNKGKPDATDIQHAEEFARNLVEKSWDLP